MSTLEKLREITFGQAVNEAIAEEMRRDPTVFILGEGIASGFEDGVVLNGKTINMPFAGLVRMPDGRLDYSDCFHYGGHLENGTPGVSMKVRGVMGFPYQAWGKLHDACTNHVHLVDKVPADALRQAFAGQSLFTIYEYGTGDEAFVNRAADLEVAATPQAR